MKKLPKLTGNTERQFIRCKECGKPYYYDYVPFSMSSGLTALPCNHDMTRRLYDCVEVITETEFMRLANA